MKTRNSSVSRRSALRRARERPSSLPMRKRRQSKLPRRNHLKDKSVNSKLLPPREHPLEIPQMPLVKLIRIRLKMEGIMIQVLSQTPRLLRKIKVEARSSEA